jgi:GNAT superfamily N-acetyltransferase
MNTLVLNEATQLHITLLNQTHISQIMHLREQVLAKLVHAEYYIREQDEYGFVKQHCGNKGETFGIFFNRKLIAYASLGFHSTLDKVNLGCITGLAPYLYDQVSQLASCMVAPDFQGLGLHKVLIKKRLALAHAKGHPHCLSVVSPQNLPSRHNLLQCGFHIQWVGELAGLSTQHILYYNARQTMPRLALHLTQSVNMLDISRQKQLLQQGYQGYANDRLDAQTLLFAPVSL